MMLQDTSRQSLSIFSEESSSNQLTAEGRVTQKADLQPFDSASYMKLKQLVVCVGLLSVKTCDREVKRVFVSSNHIVVVMEGSSP